MTSSPSTGGGPAETLGKSSQDDPQVAGVLSRRAAIARSRERDIEADERADELEEAQRLDERERDDRDATDP